MAISDTLTLVAMPSQSALNHKGDKHMSLKSITTVIEDALSIDYATVEGLRRCLLTTLQHLTRLDAVGDLPSTPAKTQIPFTVDGGFTGHFPNRFRIVYPGVGYETFELYCLDGRVTNGKIYAIKYIRQVDPQKGLKDAKDYIESLPVVYTADFKLVFGPVDNEF